MIKNLPRSLTKGWRSAASGALFRRLNKWTVIVTVDDEGFQLILRRNERTLEDAIAVANEVLTKEEQS